MSKKKLIGIIVASILGIFIVIGIATSGGETPAPVTTPAEPAQSTETEEPTPLTASEQTYAIAIGEHSGKVSTAFSELGALMSEPQIGNDEWTIDVAVQLVTIQTLYDEAMEMEPPSSMADIHYKYVQAMQHYDTAVDLVIEGIDALDADLINQATAEIETGNQFLNEATRLVEEFIATKG